MKIVQHLDWTLQSYEDRQKMVQGLIDDGLLEDLSPYQLNEVSNYLLYSEDVDVEVKLRNPTKKLVSYEELVESGMAEAELRKKNLQIYKSIKPTIDREKDKDIPGMQELWVEIDKIKEKYDYVRDCVKGLREPDFDNPIVPTFVTHNFYRTWYIDLCRKQYQLKDIFKPTICGVPTFSPSFKETDYFGIKAGKYVLDEHEKMIDLGNPDHVYQLLRQYATIREKHQEKMNDDWNYLYDALDDVIEKVNFSDTHWDILEMKVNNYSNEEISSYILKKYGVHYSINYISTIYKRHISRDIAKRATALAYEWYNREDPNNWRVCAKCGEKRFNATEYWGKNKRTCLFCTGKKKGVGRKIKLQSKND